MAATEMKLNSTLVIQYEAGVTPAGAPILRQKTLNNVRPGTDIQRLYDAAHRLFSLSEHELLHVYLRRNSELVED